MKTSPKRRNIWAEKGETQVDVSIWVASQGIGSVSSVYSLHKIVVGKPEGRSPLGRTKLKWENNIKMYFREVGWGNMDWVDLALDREKCQAVVNAVMNLRVP
jgi:hypothetical protein